MHKKIPLLLFLFGLFLVFNPNKNVYAMNLPTPHSAPTWYNEKKAETQAYIEIMIEYKEKINGEKLYNYYIYDLRNNLTNENSIKFNYYEDSTGCYLKTENLVKNSFLTWYYTVNQEGEISTGKDSPASGGYATGDTLILKLSNEQNDIHLVSYSNINFVNGEEGILSLNAIQLPPPSIDDEGVYGYEFEYPKNNDVINLLNENNNTYLKVPFKVKIKNFYAMPVKALEEELKNSFKINNYKTEITNIIFEKKSDILGMNDYALFYIEGNYSIPVGTTSDILKAQIPMPTKPFIENMSKVTYTYDGSKPSYNPIGDDSATSSVDNEGNVNIGGKSYGEMPTPPGEDADLGDWFSYIGNLLLWFVTYPFKLLGQIVSTLVGYITNMFNILTPVTAQLNSVLSFIPSDILNVCWGFISFTILYSVLKSVFKMIRG